MLPRFLEHRVSPSLPPLHRWQVLLMSVATGVAVASNYYAQPLLHTIADAFGVPFGQVGMVVTAAQLSYAAGLILLVPLGDLFERRRLIVVMSLLSAGGLVISACAPSLAWLLVGTAITGLFSVVAQVLVPFAATLAAPEHRGRVVGTLMSGLLLGILLARTVAGLLSSLGDWRLVYAIAAGTLVLTALALQRGLPRFHHSAGLGYFALLRSIGVLFVQEPVLRQRTLLGACSFAMFAIFWTPLAFLLAPTALRLQRCHHRPVRAGRCRRHAGCGPGRAHVRPRPNRACHCHRTDAVAAVVAAVGAVGTLAAGAAGRRGGAGPGRAAAARE